MNILWDFDGTLFDTYPAYTKMFKAVLGDDVCQEEIYSKLKVSFSNAIEFYNLTEEQVKVMHTMKTKFATPELVKPFPGLEEVLQNANLNVIMTHKSRDEVNEILAYHRWDKYFIDMVAGDDGFPRKPDPASYLHLHHKYNLDIAIGDRELDILPAKEIGIKTCLFQNNSKGADYYVNDYNEFYTIVKE